MTTPKAITFIVVGGLCTMALTYMITLSACVLFGIEPPEKLMGSFKDAGMFVLGAFTGILVNTRSQNNESSPAQGDFEINVKGQTGEMQKTETLEKDTKDA